MAFQRKKLDKETIKIRMADLCSRSEHCEYDIKEKLYRSGLPANDREEILRFLKEEKFIDDLRYAMLYAREKCKVSSWGQYKIRAGLVSKRIAQNYIKEALAQLSDEDWEEAIRKVAPIKARYLQARGEEERDARLKLYRFLISRGFESGRVGKIVKATLNDNNK